ncbi:MAG TPA: hypothetical protein VFY49_08010 [Myxococcota bacterium]|nr:hypothetical protein [Myxococcota bacterium]
MTRLDVALAALLLGSACATPDRVDPASAAEVPLVALVVAPEQYDGARIGVRAWGVINHETAWLLLSESDFTYLIAENGVRLEGADEIFRSVPLPYRGTLRVEGTFHAGDSRAGFRGRIEATRVVALEPVLGKPGTSTGETSP